MPGIRNTAESNAENPNHSGAIIIADIKDWLVSHALLIGPGGVRALQRPVPRDVLGAAAVRRARRGLGVPCVHGPHGGGGLRQSQR
jgi:hypothetical protein